MKKIILIVVGVLIVAILSRLGWAYYQVKSDEAKMTSIPALVTTSTTTILGDKPREGALEKTSDTSNVVVTTFATVGGNPAALAFDGKDNLYVTNTSSRTPFSISKVTPHGVSTPFATFSDSLFSITVGPLGNLYVGDRGSGDISKITPTGTVVPLAKVSGNPVSLVLDAAGSVYTANTDSDTVSKITSSGMVTTFAKVGSKPFAIIFGPNENLYTANAGSGTVSKITPSGMVTTFAVVDKWPRALVFDALGNLYVANSNSDTISKITPSGVVSTFATLEHGAYPLALVIDASGNLYTANYGDDDQMDALGNITKAVGPGNTISKITPSGSVITLATVGPRPIALAFDKAGNLYVANSGSNTVSKITFTH